jgi:predicted dehydrogenase
MSKRLAVGVIGLGRRWERYRQALAEADSPLSVRAVCDSSARRAGRVARLFGCETADGVADLLEHPDLEALLLLDPQWHGLWALERAATVGKPVFCAAPLTCDDSRADDLGRRLRQKSHPVAAALPDEFFPATARLRVLLDKHLGAARLVSCLGQVGSQVSGEAILNAGALLPTLHLCARLLGDAPETVWTAAPSGCGMVNLTLAFSAGRAALVSLCPGRHSGWRVAVTAEHGSAEAVLPRRLRWRDAAGEHVLRLPPRSTPKEMLRRFAETVRAGQPLQPGFDDALQVLRWLRAARRSHAENRPVRIADG